MYATLGNKELTRKMSATNAKALNTMRQRLRKHNPQYAEQVGDPECMHAPHYVVSFVPSYSAVGHASQWS